MAAKKRSTKVRRPLKQSGKTLSKVRRSLGETGGTGCSYSIKWSELISTKGFTQVWVPNDMYDKVAASFMKRSKGRKYPKSMFRARMAPLGLNVKCGGTCSGGWCQEHLIQDGGSSKLYVCECAYFV
jgi:hypothetical protein